MMLADDNCVHFRCQMSLEIFKQKLNVANIQRVRDGARDKDGVPSYWFVERGYDFVLARGEF